MIFCIKIKKLIYNIWEINEFNFLTLRLFLSQKFFMKIDLTYLREMSGGNQGLIIEMIDIFRSQVVEFTEGMEQHLKNKEYEKLGKLAHKAKSSISIMGLAELAIQLKSLELMACAGTDIEKYPVIIERFKVETLEAVTELNEVTKNLELYFKN